MKIKVLEETSRSYPRYYPACDTSRLFAEFRNRPTFTERHIEVLKKIGIEIEIIKAEKERYKYKNKPLITN